MSGAPPVGRLAPTPSGQLHLGNVCAFAAAWLSARRAGGTLLLRIEDIDTARARAGIEHDQRDDLDWLGLRWDRETPRQSDREYDSILLALGDRVYRCACTRADLVAAGGVYPGTCHTLHLAEGAARFALTPGPMHLLDRRWGPRTIDPSHFGDPVLRRRDGVWAYNLAVVADDLRDGVTEVVRGADLLDYSAVQVQLWHALGAPPPTWLHSPLILGPDARKLAKSHASSHVGALRALGWQPHHVWRLVLPWLGLEGVDRLEDAITAFDPRAGHLGPIQLDLAAGAEPAPGAPVPWRLAEDGHSGLATADSS